MAFVVTDAALILQLEYMLLENGDADADGTLLSTMFTTTDFANALDRAQKQFFKDTGIVQTSSTVGVIAGQTRYNLPARTIQLKRVTFTDFDGDIKVLSRSDGFALDRGASNWTVDSSEPYAFISSHHGTLKFEIAPVPNDVGTLGPLTVQLPTDLDGSGVPLEVPDDFAPYILYGALSSLLGDEGEANDPQRAAYCDQRYQEGVELVRLMLGGTGNA